jgi:putative glutamine transport system permease protein
VYVEVFQNTPLVVQVFFVYNALPYVGIRLDVFLIGMLCVGIYHGAYVAEVFRAGITSIPKGQMEAARSQGFSYVQAMQYIILPQTVTIVLPPLANQAVNLVKNTSTLALIAGGDLMYRADSWASNGTLSYGPAYITTGLLYFALCFPLVTWARRHEARIKNRELVPAAAGIPDAAAPAEGIPAAGGGPA